MLTEKQIEKLNKKFTSLSKAEQRVAIAKDVLAQLNADKINATTGHYVRVQNSWKFGEKESVQKHVDEIECSCCALGACLLSTTKFVNKVKFKDFERLESGDKAWNILKGIFTPKQLQMIEFAFEATHSGTRVGANFSGDRLDFDTQSNCIKFGDKYYGTNSRLIAIMKNIIKNKGTFKV